MDVKNLKDLKLIMALCKKQGVKSIEISGIRMEFDPSAIKAKTKLEDSSQELKPDFLDNEYAQWSQN